jgi:SPP1 gp7 family putative phage head morphogenesis protein
VQRWADKIKASVSKSCYEATNLFLNFQEKTEQESAFVGDTLNKPFNNDDLYEKASDYSIYEQMLQDGQVYSATQLKKDIIIGSGWEIETQEDGQEEVQADIEKMFREDLDRPLEDMLQEILSAYDFGFSLTEKIFKRRPDGSITLRTLKTRHPGSWLIFTDKFGSIEKIEQQGTSTNLVIDPKVLIHLVNNDRFQNPYGISDLRSIYEPYFMKRHLKRFYAIFLERSAGATPIGRYDTGAPPEAIDTFDKALKNFQAKTSLVIPKELEVEFLEAKSNGEAYINGLNVLNLMIGRGILLPDLIGLTGSEQGGGSFALGKEQLEIFFKHVRRRRQTIESLIDNHIIKPVVLSNFGEMDHFPKFRFKEVKKEDEIEKAKLWIEAQRYKVYKPTDEEVNHLRELTDFPTSDVVEFPEQRPPPGESPFQENEPLTGLEEVSDDKVNEDIEKMKGPPEESKKKGFALFKKPEGDFADKVDFRALERQLESSVDKFLRSTKPLTREIWSDIIDQIESKKIIQQRNFDRIKEIKPRKLGTLKKAIKERMRAQFSEAELIAKGEIENSKNLAKPLPPSDFLDFSEAEAFSFVGELGDNMTKKAGVVLRESIRDGKSVRDVLEDLTEQGNELTDKSLDLMSRNLTASIENQARMKTFMESPIIQAVQFSAILDAGTTVICSGLHGKIFLKGNAPVPQLHHGCRSLLIPITQFEKFKVDTKTTGPAPVRKGVSKPSVPKGQNIDKFIDENIGKGFSRR